MPKLGCPCGFVHNLTPMPDDGWVTIPDADMDGPEDRKRRGSLYECPQCGRIMWRKPGSGGYDIFLPAESSRHFQSLVLAAASEFEREQNIVREEAIRTHNEAAKIVAQKMKKDGLRCPYCFAHSHEMQFVDRNPTGWAFFQCPACSRTFRLERYQDVRTT
jgi:DNA-directed RNA polymerase subunit RPC12/RpoP